MDCLTAYGQAHIRPCKAPEKSYHENQAHIFFNPLSTYWKGHYVTKYNVTTGQQVAAYFGGMGAYLLALIWRLGGLVKDFFLFLGSLCCGDTKGRGIALLGSLGEVGAALVGIVCPPAAYKLDESIQRNPTVQHYTLLNQKVGHQDKTAWEETYTQTIPKEVADLLAQR